MKNAKILKALGVISTLMMVLIVLVCVGCTTRNLDLVGVELTGSVLPQNDVANATPVKLVLLSNGHGFAVIQKKSGDMFSWELKSAYDTAVGEERHTLFLKTVKGEDIAFNVYKQHLLHGTDKTIISVEIERGDLVELNAKRLELLKPPPVEEG
jgi:hypothetical protein